LRYVSFPISWEPGKHKQFKKIRCVNCMEKFLVSKEFEEDKENLDLITQVEKYGPYTAPEIRIRRVWFKKVRLLVSASNVNPDLKCTFYVK